VVKGARKLTVGLLGIDKIAAERLELVAKRR
jgi:hypothetical protein